MVFNYFCDDGLTINVIEIPRRARDGRCTRDGGHLYEYIILARRQRYPVRFTLFVITLYCYYLQHDIQQYERVRRITWHIVATTLSRPSPAAVLCASVCTRCIPRVWYMPWESAVFFSENVVSTTYNRYNRVKLIGKETIYKWSFSVLSIPKTSVRISTILNYVFCCTYILYLISYNCIVYRVLYRLLCWNQRS